MLKYRVMWLDVEEKKWELEEFPFPPYTGIVDVGVEIHLNRVKSWEGDVFSGKNVLFLGTGPFAGSRMFGSH
ncbi:MAG: aldehyde ferredoxin oxidoreductase, partial [Thermodesulfobacteria bacterium]|nr:aldehyde ferredoxin oxidoreductase [Thermodesulfobacteriota bacterium]